MTDEQQKKQLGITFTWDGGVETLPNQIEGAESEVAGRNSVVPVPENLMVEVANVLNLRQAFLDVKANNGKPGIDSVSVEEYGKTFLQNRDKLSQDLLNGTYKPKAVKRVEIEKPGGGTRKLGIPTVQDRVVQQAILRVVQRYWDKTFSESSFGFRPNRSAHQAVQQAQQYVSSGQHWVVDIDLEKFFDRVNHDILMALVAKRVKDKRLLKLIRAFLNAGVLEDGIVIEEKEGTPQGGPLSPWLSNVMLDELDKELEKRQLRFVRYADDCNIYVSSERAGQRVMEGITKYLSKKLRLKVNTEKSAVAHPWERQFLGFTFARHANRVRIQIGSKALNRAKDKIREITKPTRGGSFTVIVKELQLYAPGWLQYFRLCDLPSQFKALDGWLRRRLRCILWIRWKTTRKRRHELIKRGVEPVLARKTAGTSKGPWRISSSPVLHMALPNAYFKDIGVPSLLLNGT